jgi:hypothetical protein
MSYNDTLPPRVFNVVTSAKVTYNMDFVEYLIQQEITRRRQSRQAALNRQELDEFRRQLIATLIIRGDAEGAINLRPTHRQLLLEDKDL